MLEGVLYLAFVLAAVFLGWRFWDSVRRNPGIREAMERSGEVYYFISTAEPAEDFFAPQRLWRPGRAVPALVFWLACLWIALSSLEVILMPGIPLLNFLLSVALGLPLAFLSMAWFAKS